MFLFTVRGTGSSNGKGKLRQRRMALWPLAHCGKCVPDSQLTPLATWLFSLSVLVKFLYFPFASLPQKINTTQDYSFNRCSKCCVLGSRDWHLKFFTHGNTWLGRWGLICFPFFVAHNNMGYISFLGLNWEPIISFLHWFEVEIPRIQICKTQSICILGTAWSELSVF